MEDLEALGWTVAHQQRFGARGDSGAIVGRVAAVERGGALLLGLGEPRLARLSTALATSATSALGRPTVGDWVACRELGGDLEISELLPRSSCFVRKASGRDAVPQLVAANVDQVLVVTAIGDDLSARRMQRYAAAVWAGGAEPVLVINKSDRPHDRSAVRRELAEAVPGATVVGASAVDEDGLDELGALLVPRSTVALVGSSGVGKSTIVNRLLGHGRQKTSDVRAADDKGRHTTTRRELLIAPSGVILIDTPGMRELGLWDAEAGLATAFADIAELAESCRFRDCEHHAEPGCAVKRAVKAGLLPIERLDSYRALARELSETSTRARERLASVKSRTKAISRAVRQRKKLHKKLGFDDD